MKLTFKGSGQKDFFSTLKKKVDTYFKENNLPKSGNNVLYTQTALMAFIQIALYALILSNFLNAPLLILTFMAFGLASGAMDFMIVHDALHGAFSSKPWVNKLAGYLFDLNGTSSYVWKLTHNVIHHTYTNIPGYDHDIDKAILLRLNPKDKLYSFHYYQNIYAFLLYPFVTANWIFYSDYVVFYQEYKKGKVQRKDLLTFFGFKALNFILFVLLPILLIDLPIWTILLAYFCGHLAAGFCISLIFQLAHVTENVEYYEPDIDGNIPNNWAVHEMMTTSNFATDNKLLTYLVGGLNFQVEHHLFPNICHIHYPAIQKIVKETAREYYLPYKENMTFTEAIKSHYNRIKRLGRQESLASEVK